MRKLSKEEVYEGLEQISETMKIKAELHNPDGIWEKLNRLSVLLPNNAEYKAQAEILKNAKEARIIESGVFKTMGSAEKKVMINSSMEEELYLYNKANSLSDDLYEEIRSLITMISYAKKGFETLKYQPEMTPEEVEAGKISWELHKKMLTDAGYAMLIPQIEKVIKTAGAEAVLKIMQSRKELMSQLPAEAQGSFFQGLKYLEYTFKLQPQQ